MNVLVTGGAGFIGSSLIRFLVGRTEVERLVNLDCLTYAGQRANVADAAKDSKYHFELVDLRDASSVVRVMMDHEITHVVHLAAESHVDRSIASPRSFIDTNIVGTFNLLETCRRVWAGDYSGRRLHHVSTDEVYGSLGPDGHFSETTAYDPRSPYSASKASADMLVRSYHHTYELPVVISNSSNNYGPYQHPEKLIPVVLNSIFHQQPIPLYGDGGNVRDWLFVRDHVDALWQVLTRGTTGQTYNVGARNEWSNLDLVHRLCDLCDEFLDQPDDTARRLIAFVKDRPGHDRRYAIDPTKLETELGWTPTCSFEDGLRETIHWYKDNAEWVAQVRERT